MADEKEKRTNVKMLFEKQLVNTSYKTDINIGHLLVIEVKLIQSGQQSQLGGDIPRHPAVV